MALLMLSKIFSREKGIWYAYVWDVSDRLGFKKYLNHRVKHNLFIREGAKLSVLYNNRETEEIHKKIKDKYLRDKKFVNVILHDLSREWTYLAPYLERRQKIEGLSEFRRYYTHLVKWWAAMAILFRLELSEELAGSALEYRQKAEKFSDAMIEVWDEFFVKKRFKGLANLVTPKEAFALTDLTMQKIAEIKKRNRGVALYNRKLYPLSWIHQILKKRGVTMQEEKIGNVTEIKGVVAFKGKVVGAASVVLLNKDIPKVKRGDILVAEMTSPAYVPAIKKAVGLITDEGGITSHAAIVSRELKKPCILATKIATKVLKDGDLIKLDTDKGIVKILKRTM